ncbi:MAG: ABC transporter substrate-binding protein [Saprospiraceae bacterium]|jgi:iron complex transport system substrate-binding protein|nr:ABC transporter substrate-binding protein [Saprospiraceae bacterium]
MRNWFSFSFVLFALASCQPDAPAAASSVIPEPRIISLSGAITETVYVLGYGSKVVGVDVTSTYPPEAQLHPKVGHVRSLNAEGLLSLQPTLILAEQSEFNSPALKQVEAAGIRVAYLEKPFSLEAPDVLFQSLGQLLGLPAQQYQREMERIALEREQLARGSKQLDSRPKVAFIYSRGKGQMLLAGKNTAADAMIQAVGGVNPLQDFEDFRAFSQEGLLAADPDVLLLFSTGQGTEADTQSLAQIQGLEQTKAGKNKHIVFMDGNYVLGFGPRSIAAALELQQKIIEFGY